MITLGNRIEYKGRIWTIASRGYPSLRTVNEEVREMEKMYPRETYTAYYSTTTDRYYVVRLGG